MTLLHCLRDTDWIGCVDFGTAYSKFAMVRAVDREELTKDDICPLAIGQAIGFANSREWLLPSVLYITEKNVLFGAEAESEALKALGSVREAFVSPKQYLSTYDLSDYDAPLPKEIDPTGKFTARKLLRLFMGHLLERAGAHAVSANLPWPVPLRVARPGWEPDRARVGERLLRDLVVNGFAIVDNVGPAISKSGGLELQAALSALDDADKESRRAEKDKTISPNMFKVGQYGRFSVPEATAAASNSNRARGRRVVVVADIGGGTSDFGSFMTPVSGQRTIAEVAGSSKILKEAGDFLDMQLVRFILAEAGYLEDHHASRGPSKRLTRQGRQNKETLFTQGALAVEINDRIIKVTLAKFLTRQEVEEFAQRLMDRFKHSLLEAKQCAQNNRSRGGFEPPIEIMLTGGGHSLPMVRALLENHGLPGLYTPRSPELLEEEHAFAFDTIRPQLAVAIGGAVKDLPTTRRLDAGLDDTVSATQTEESPHPF
jgi:molecular chaperone DnaK (HSP70)